MQFRTILLSCKKYVTKKRTYANKGCNLLNPYFLTCMLSIPFDNLPCFCQLNDLEFMTKSLLEKVTFRKKMQFQTILLSCKKYVTKKRTYANKGCNLLNPYFLTCMLSIPFDNLPCFCQLNDLEFMTKSLLEKVTLII